MCLVKLIIICWIPTNETVYGDVNVFFKDFFSFVLSQYWVFVELALCRLLNCKNVLINVAYPKRPSQRIYCEDNALKIELSLNWIPFWATYNCDIERDSDNWCVMTCSVWCMWSVALSKQSEVYASPWRTLSLRMCTTLLWRSLWIWYVTFDCVQNNAAYEIRRRMSSLLTKNVFFSVFFQAEPFAAILVAHRTHGRRQKFVFM